MLVGKCCANHAGSSSPTTNNQWRTGRCSPRIHDIRLRLEISRATGTRASGLVVCGSIGNCSKRCQYHLSTCATCPGRKWNARSSAGARCTSPTGDSQPNAHNEHAYIQDASEIRRPPPKTLFLIQDTNKPLPRLQVFNRRTAALMRPNVMLYRLLVQKQTFLRKIAQDTLTCL